MQSLSAVGQIASEYPLSPLVPVWELERRHQKEPQNSSFLPPDFFQGSASLARRQLAALIGSPHWTSLLGSPPCHLAGLHSLSPKLPLPHWLKRQACSAAPAP